MRASSVTAIVSVLVVLLASLPAGLSGQSPRGATLLVTKTDGSQIAGELIAAKPEGLLLLDGRGLDVSVPYRRYPGRPHHQKVEGFSIPADRDGGRERSEAFSRFIR